MGASDLYPILLVYPRLWRFGACGRIGRGTSNYPTKFTCFGRSAANRDPPFDELSILYLWRISVSTKHPQKPPRIPSHKRTHHRDSWLHFSSKWLVDDACLHLSSRITGKLAVLGADNSWNFNDRLSSLGGGRNPGAQNRPPRWRYDFGLRHRPRRLDADLSWNFLDNHSRIRGNGADT